MPQFLSPVCNDQMFDVNGDPLNGGQVETYIAGSATPAATYTSSAGTVQQANPIILNSLGKTSSPIWLAAGVAYKFVVKDSNGVTLWTLDGISGVNDASVSVSEWVDSGFVPTYIGATSFSVPGDQTGILQVGRRLKTVNTSGVIYSGISASVFGSGVTTVTVLNDSGTLDAGLSALAYGLISADNTSFPFATFAAANTVAVSNDDATNSTHYPLFADGTAGQENVKTGTAKLKYNPSTGTLESTKFKGDGSELTAIPAAQLTGDAAWARLSVAINANVFGMSQTWQDVKASRVDNTSYQNTTARPIQVFVSQNDATGNNYMYAYVSTDGSTWLRIGSTMSSSSTRGTLSFVVPAGHYYKVDSSEAFTDWSELR